MSYRAGAPPAFGSVTAPNKLLSGPAAACSPSPSTPGTSTVNVSDPPVMASNSTDSEGLVQLDPVRPNTTDSLPTDVYASTTSPVETQHELAKHYQEIHNLGEKEKGGKNKDG